MKLEKGLVVLSKAGRDKGCFFVVLSSEERYVFLIDGRMHPLERPKKKNRVHISATKLHLPQESMVANSEIQKALKKLQG